MTIALFVQSIRIDPDKHHWGTSQTASHTEILTLPKTVAVTFLATMYEYVSVFWTQELRTYRKMFLL